MSAPVMRVEEQRAGRAFARRGSKRDPAGKISLTNRAARFMLCQPSRGSVSEMKNIIVTIIPIIIDIIGIRPGGVGG
jgi:hypothetical protein